MKKFLDSDFKTPSTCGGPYLDKCVSVAITEQGIGVRDTKDTGKTTLVFTHNEWNAFVLSVKKGEFDL